VRAALRTVNLVEVLEWEVQFCSKGFNPGSEVALGQGRKLVEEWLNESGVDHDHDHLEHKPEGDA
jgi:hypothetical protein